MKSMIIHYTEGGDEAKRMGGHRNGLYNEVQNYRMRFREGKPLDQNVYEGCF